MHGLALEPDTPDKSFNPTSFSGKRDHGERTAVEIRCLGDAIVCPLVQDTDASGGGFSCFPDERSLRMRRVTLSLTVTIMALALASGVAVAQVVTCPTGANGLCVGTNGNDTLNGTIDPDDMRGLEGQDTLNAGAELDSLSGGRGNDVLKGEADNDGLSGDLGNDTMNGGPGDDEYRFANGWGNDRISDATQGVSGERLTFSLVTQPVEMDLISNPSRPEARSGANTVNFGSNVEVNSIDGSSAGDDIKGDDGPDSINGIQGNDTVRGRAGVDGLMGMDGGDELFGGAGGDTLAGEKGADVIHADDGQPVDTISCGAGNDTVFFDQGDTLVGANACEDKRLQ